MEKDNDYVEGTAAETLAEAKTGVGGEKDGSKQVFATLGKFKDVNALLKAYDCLQAEFTRRSQRLKELEKERENSSQKAEAEGMAEKLRKNAEKIKRDEEKFDAFIAEVEGANVRARQEGALDGEEPIALEVGEGELREKGAESPQKLPRAAETRLAEGEYFLEEGGEKEGEKCVAVSRKERSLSLDEVYRLANGNEEVRLKIIGEYLHSVGKTGAPLSKGGNGVISAKPMKAKSLQEAGEMTLQWMRREGAKG